MAEVGALSSIACMHGGSEEHGYAKNSVIQNFTFHTYAKPHLSQALIQLLEHFIPSYFPAPNQGLCDDPPPQQLPCGCPFGPPRHVDNTNLPCSTCDVRSPCHHACNARLVVADFGCSHGPNTLDHAKFIVQVMLQYLTSSRNTLSVSTHQEPKPTIEIQYFFSDLPSNNFNSLLQSLDSFWVDQVQHDDGPSPFNVEIFDGVVAGSFHKRLFPTASLHLGISIFCLQWLSQVPQEVVNEASPSWNGGHIWLHGRRPAVVDAYTRQFEKDFSSFLFHRARELVSGGILFLFFIGRMEKNPNGPFFTPNDDLWNGCYEDTWKEMVKEGLISKEEMDMFNLPFFICHLSELQELLNEFSAEFKVLKMDVLQECKNFPKSEEKSLQEDPQAFGEYWSKFLATLMEPIMQAHLGSSRTRVFFERLKHQATLKAHLSTSMAYDMALVVIQRI